MSRTSLDDLPIDKPSDQEPYEPGAEVDPALIEQIISHTHPTDEHESMEELLKDIIPLGLEAGTLLDALVMRLADEIDRKNIGPKGYVLDSVVQHLYSRGDNGFLIDLSPLQVRSSNRQHLSLVGYVLEGTPERPLECSYIGNIYQFGQKAKHCILRLNGHSPHPAWRAESSDFYLDTLNPGLMVATYYDNLDIDNGPVDCRFFLSEGVKNLDVPFPKAYFKKLLERGNTFYEPDENGEWKEVTL